MAEADRAVTKKPLTFRVQQIPATVSRANFAAFFDGLTEGGFGGTNNIHVRSLAPSVVLTKQTATLDFTTVPSIFLSQDQTTWEFSVPSSSAYITVDTTFIGFTPLNDVRNNNDQHHDYDCIAISGLAGHAFGSWRRHALPGSTRQFMWLRDQFAFDFPRTRVLLYGYDTRLINSHSTQTIDDIARTLTMHLKAIGCADPSARPVMIFAHSLGGILVKRLLFDLARSGEVDEYMLSKIKLVVFFGVPNKGMKVEHLHMMVAQQPNQSLVHSLSIDNAYLRMLDDALSGTRVYQDIRLVSVYETKASATSELQPDGSYSRTGQPALLVSKDSAISRASRDTDDVFHIDEDHSDLVRFSPDDLSYLTITKIVGQISSEKPTIIRPPRDGNSAVKELHVDVTTTNIEEPRLQSVVSSSKSHSVVKIRDSGGTTDAERVLFESEVFSLTQSLAFEEIETRHQAIDEAHEATFEWVFNKDLAFMDWIRTGTGVYWIEGKPGSGKSTLMKYLRRQDKFRRAIRGSSSTPLQLDFWFFFNERGTYLQRTLEGLLRTILLRLIGQNDAIAALVLELYRLKISNKQREWFVTDLKQAFAKIMSQADSDLNLILFLDALDEYHGRSEDICEWIQNMTRSSILPKGRTQMKICFSSRLWDSFDQAFRGVPGFALHEHTQHDIRTFALWHLREMASESAVTGLSSLLQSSDIRFDDIVEVIIKNAQGVFLWLKLALNELKFATDINTIKDLGLAVDKLPLELQEFYLRTIARIPTEDRFRAFVILELVLRSAELVDPGGLYVASVTAEGRTFQECCNLHSKVTKERKHHPDQSIHASRNLLSFCGGLIEMTSLVTSLSKTGKTIYKGEPYIQFAHLTVKSFVESTVFAQAMLGDDHLAMQINGYTFWWRFELASTYMSNSRLTDLSFRYALKDEKSNGRAAETLLDSVPLQSLKDIFPLIPTINTDTKETEGISIIHFVLAIVTGLRLYVREKFAQVQLAQLQSLKPLHAIALFAAMKGWSEGAAEMTSMLLEAGIQSGTHILGLRPFDILLASHKKEKTPLDPARYSAEAVGILQVLIKKGGQDPDERINRCELIPGHVIYYDSAGPPACSALHVATPLMANMLLESGANPNHRDHAGRTPLDEWVGSGSALYPYRENFVTVVPMCEVLMKHGAQLTRHGRAHVGPFLKNLHKLGIETKLKSRLASLPDLEDDVPSQQGSRYRRRFQFRFVPRKSAKERLL